MGRTTLAAVVTLALSLAAACGPAARQGGDAAPVDAPADAARGDGPPPVGFGEPCTDHAGCTTGYCVEAVGGSGGVCSRTCAADCPAGYDCLPVAFPAGMVDLCIPSSARQCLACVADAECPGGACLESDGGKRCAATCSAQSQCTAGYTCAADPTGAHPGKFCQPTTGSCSCGAATDGEMRACASANALGTCLGTQRCDKATGWSACTARTAEAEACDGVDNDCDFVIDDGVGGGEACVNTVAGIGSCPGVRTCGGTGGFVCNGPQPAAEACNSQDDDCDGRTDEGFAGLGDLCSAGVGGCVRFGSVRCAAGGAGTECSAVAGAPAAETCNRIDDDCNGAVDEAFPMLGAQCAVGAGACMRYGSYVCDASGAGVACSATPGPPAMLDTCNYVDDDCDGVVDGAFRDPVTGAYATDANCGACGNDCALYYTGAHASGACVVAGTPRCVMKCDPGTADLNVTTVDGCEFVLDATAIYVSADDATARDDATCGLGPTGTGAGNHPCASITYGLARATATGRARVDVADATYREAVALVNGKSLYGGYRADTWERHLDTTGTVIQGVSSVGVHDRTVTASGITAPTVFEGFVVRGSINTKAGGNSYAIYVAGSSANLVLRANEIFAGRGGPGAAGAPGLNGAAGTNGATYSPSLHDSFQVTGTTACPATSNRAASGGAVRACGGDDVGGGNGGGVNCTPLISTQNSTGTSPATAGQPGAGTGGGAGGAAGTRGWDGDQQSNTCYLPSSGATLLPQAGSDGRPGGVGGNAAGVAGCASAAGSVVAGEWTGGAATSGIAAANGGGGGGGGAGGGATCTSCIFGNGINSMLGAHGGGGAGGGCGGAGGGAGGAGGGVFGIFVTGGAAPTITGNAITGGTAGDGGAGGIGGAGGLGGTGSPGGQTSMYFCTGKGGRGGDGGAGGAGSGGGGGCGGSSYGIYTAGVGAPGYCASNTVTTGAAGAAGAGGYSAGASGGAGVVGLASPCTSI